MPITYAVERLPAVKAEIEAWAPAHWWEIAIFKDKIKLDVDWPRYQAIDDSGILRIITARDDGKLIGYFVGFLAENPRYKGLLRMQADIYYVARQYRGKHVGSGMFRFMEQVSRDLGAVEIVVGHKAHSDNSKFLEHLGYELIERTHGKLLI
jgi:GNAT superfamily N-acetyltransferase